MKLSDEQCDDLRRLPGSFNDMVRKIFEIGRMDAAQEAAEVMKKSYPKSGCYRIIESHFDFKLSV
jgi:hypothetical protein